MNHSIRTRFTLGMIFLFFIILVLSVFSGYFMNKLANKISAIHKENYVSVVYAREMSEGLVNINQEITTCYLMNTNTDSLFITNELSNFTQSLNAEKNNITESGEERLVSDIETGYTEYHDSVMKYMRSPLTISNILYLQKKSGNLYQQLALLSEINGKAIEVKTNDARISSKNALTKMTILSTISFLIALSFTYNFATYFNQRVSQLYNGIKEIVASNFDQRLFFEGKDEFYEISLVLNEMAEKLNKNTQKMSVTLQEELRININSDDIDELKKMLLRIKSIEEQATSLITRFEKK